MGRKAGRLVPGPTVCLALLVVVSIVIRIAAARTLEAPWIAPDEFVYSLSGKTFWSTGSLALFGSKAPFYGIYPFLAGLPVALFGAVGGLFTMQVVQAVVASLTVVVVYAWARQMVSPRWALTSALMTAALPALTYTGLLMTESLFLSAATFAMWMTTRAIKNPTLARQAGALGAALLAATIRLQGFVLAPTLIIALALVVICTRNVQLVRRFAPSILAVVIAGSIVAILRVAGSGSPLGAYETAARSRYEFGTSVEWIGWHLVDVAILVCVFPLFAVLMLLVEVLRRRETDLDVVALVSVSVAYLATSVALVGVFSSQHVGQLAERDLISLAPPLFIAFCVWLARGMPRPRPYSIIIGFALACLASFLPIQDVVTRRSTPDAFMLVPLLKLRETVSTGTFELVWALIVVLAFAVVLTVPKRGAAGLAAFVVVTLAAASILAQVVVDHRTTADRREFFGTGEPDWIDRQAPGQVTFLYANDRLWNRVWQTVYWNSKISSVVALSGQRSFGPVPGDTDADLLEDGTLVKDGRRIRARFMVAPSYIGVAGTRIASVRGKLDLGLSLWRASQPARLSYRITTIPGTGKALRRITVEVFGCDGGSLGTTISARRPGTLVNVRVDSSAGSVLRVPAGARLATKTSLPRLTGSRRMCFVKFDSRATIRLGALHLLPASGRALRLGPVLAVPVVPATPIAIGYCLRGKFVNLAFRQPELDLKYRDATVANYIDGRGITCDAPPRGFVTRGLAPSSLGVTGDVYPYYVPVRKSSKGP